MKSIIISVTVLGTAFYGFAGKFVPAANMPHIHISSGMILIVIGVLAVITLFPSSK